MSDLRVLLIADGFFDDLLISIESILRNSPSPITVLVNGKQPVGPLANFQNDRLQISEIKQALGWGNAINFLLEASSEKYVVVMDPSTTFTGDAITPSPSWISRRGSFLPRKEFQEELSKNSRTLPW